MLSFSYLALSLVYSINFLSSLSSVRAATANDWRTRSIYQIIVDRYALPAGADLNACDPGMQSFCGGTWNTIRQNLDYVQNAGFTAIWISPVSKNYEGERTPYGDPYHGYWISDASQLNDKFGTSDDLKALSNELHKRGMYLMVDVVVNNVMSLSATDMDYSQFLFKDESLYHPYCPIEWGNRTSEQDCWLGDTKVYLPDVKTEDPTVVSTYNNWIKNLVQEYNIDGLRIDAAKHVNTDFWPGFCASAGVFCIGEVFDADPAEAAEFQGPNSLDSILHYPMYNALTAAFAIPGPQNMSAMSDMITRSKSLFTDPTLLGNFLENQDVPRWGNISVDPQSLYNAMVYNFMSDGIPIVYYGQEQGFSGAADPYNREPLWTSGYNQTTAYNLTVTLNQFRNYLVSSSDWANQSMSILTQNDVGLAIKKGDVFTIVTNIGSPPNNASIPIYTGLPPSTILIDVLSCNQYSTGSGGTIQVVYSQGGHASVFYEQGKMQGTGLCGYKNQGSTGGSLTSTSTSGAPSRPESCAYTPSRSPSAKTSRPSSAVGVGGPSGGRPASPARLRAKAKMDPSGAPTNTNVHAIVKAQIVFLLSTLTEENFEQNQLQIRTLSEQHGLNTYLHFIRRLIVHSQARLTSTAAPTAFDTSTSLTFRLLVQETQRLARDPFLADRFREGVDRGDGEIFRAFDLVRFADRVGLRPLERLVLAASIAAAGVSPSQNTGQGQNTAPGQGSGVRKALADQAATIIRVDFENAVLALCQHPCFDHADLSPAQAGKLLQNLLSDPPRDAPILDATQRQALVAAAQTKFGVEMMSPILSQLFQNLSLPPQTTVVQVLNQFGPEITGDVDVVRGLLTRFGMNDQTPPSDEQIVDIFSTLSRLTVENAQLCDVAALVRALSSFRVKHDWSKVIHVFDWPDRQGVDTNTLKLLIAILVNSPRDVEKPAVSGFWSQWNNSLYQLRLLDALLSLPSDTFNFVSLPGRRVVTVEDVAAASPTIKTLAANVQSHTWNSLDLFEVLVRLGDSENENVRNCVREMLDKAVRISADIVHMGLLQAPKPWNALQVEYSRQLLGMFLSGHPNHQLVFMRIWQIEPSYLTSALREFYEENPMNITRILDVAQDLKILDSLLEVRPFVFALDVASLASRREYLNLDKWLEDNIIKHGAEFLHGIIVFLETKMQNEKIARTIDPQAENRTMALSPTTIAIFLRALRNFSSVMDEADMDFCIETRNACLQIHPRLMVLNPSAENQEPGFSVVNYPPNIEAEVDGIFKQMYDEQITIDQVIVMLQRTKESTNPRDHEIFSCMLHFLFDEYKFFQTFYPPRELAMTGYLFGSIIQQQLVDYIPLGIAIRYVIDSLQCPPETNLFKFGVQALSRFESRLPEWKVLCEALLSIPHLAEQRPDIIEVVRRALATPAESTSVTNTLQAFPSSLSLIEAQPAFTAIKPDQLDDDTIQSPPEETSDKILFIINNLAPSNFDAKLAEMKSSFEELYSRWLANYLIDQRVSSEPNNHQLYLRFLDGLDCKKLAKFILHETYIKSTAMLNSDKTKASASERTLLKNLASWLGQITLARDKPIKHKNIAFKELLIEGAESDRLLVAIPFVCKVLEGASKSKAFRPPNPWLMAVISVLAELYHFAELKLQIKFEIEFLCKALGIDLETVEVSNIFRSRPQAESLAGPGLPELMPDIDNLPMGGYDHQAATDGQVISLGTSGEIDRNVGAHIEELLAQLASAVTINSQLGPLSNNQLFKQAIQDAIDRSVREIILPVVERSVTIAGITSRELCVKDFASEASEEKLRKAGHLTCQKLASSLALITCKEPLRTNIPGHIRTYLAEHGFTEQMVHEQVIMLITQDNLDIACETIEKAAMDRATREVDTSLALSYDARRRHREMRSNQTFWDPHAGQIPFIANLPDSLRIKPMGLQPHQLRVYEDFATEGKRRSVSRPNSTVQYSREPVMQTAYSPSPVPDHQVAPSNASYAILEQFNVLIQKLEAILPDVTYPSFSSVPLSHEIRNILHRLVSLSVDCFDRVRTPLLMSQKIVQHLYKTPLQLGREVYVTALEQLCRTYDDVAKEAINWLICAEDDRKFNIPVTVTLIRSRLITVTDEDLQLAKWLFSSNNIRPNLQDFASGLIRECLSTEIATQISFQYTLDALSQLVRTNKATDSVVQLLNELQGQTLQNNASNDAFAVSGPAKQETEQIQTHLLKCFQQWVSVFQRSSAPEKMFVPYVTQLSKQGILKAEDMSSFFFRVCTESSIAHYSKCMASGEYDHSFLALDAMSRLIVYIIKYHGDASGANNLQAKVHYFSKILSIVVLVIANRHEEQGTAFQQKPFFRFFSSLLSDLHSLETQLGSVYFALLLALSDTLSSLQPTYFPGFSFSWMTLISHRLYMPKLLSSENREGWSAFHKLLTALFRFLAPFLSSANFTPASRSLYRGTLRLLLVLLHDFPDFLSEYYFSLCDIIPHRCIQLSNIILSAFPASVNLPDPHLRNINFESLTEMGPIPPIVPDFAILQKSGDLKAHLDQCLANRVSQVSLSTLKERLRLQNTSPVILPPSNEENYNISLMNTMVMYIGVTTVAQAKARSGNPIFNPSDPAVVVLSYLAYNLDPEGQHHLVSAMVLHLRYPNAHTHWFSSLVLHLFEQANDETFREILTRVLLERFIVHRPHPWGALLTFIELLRNPKYDFWNKDFVRAVPEVTLMLDNVARSVFQP